MKKDFEKMTFDEFKKEITNEMLDQLKEMDISYERAYLIFKELLKESEIDETIQTDSMEIMVKTIIKDYTEELMYKAFNKYELDWE